MSEANKLLPNEVYRLTLEHYLNDEDGNKHHLEDPLVVKAIYDRRYGSVPYLLNHMLDMMKDTVLRKWGNAI